MKYSSSSFASTYSSVDQGNSASGGGGGGSRAAAADAILTIVVGLQHHHQLNIYDIHSPRPVLAICRVVVSVAVVVHIGI